MGTRSTTRFFDGDTLLLTVYKQFDGYPEGLGKDLAEWLNGIKVVNGYQSDQKAGKFANGAGCLAAQFIAKWKTDIGGIYITNPEDEQEYNYIVKVVRPSLAIKIGCKEIQDVRLISPAEFLKTIEKL